MLLKEHHNYLYFAKADLIENTLPARVSTVTVFATRQLIFCIPIKEFRSYLVLQQSKRFSYFDGVSPSQGVYRFLNQEGLTLEEAEKRLREMLEGDSSCKIFNLSDLEQFKLGLGLLGQALLMQPEGENRFQLMIKGRKARQSMRAFYEL